MATMLACYSLCFPPPASSYVDEMVPGGGVAIVPGGSLEKREPTESAAIEKSGSVRSNADATAGTGAEVDQSEKALPKNADGTVRTPEPKSAAEIDWAVSPESKTAAEIDRAEKERLEQRQRLEHLKQLPAQPVRRVPGSVSIFRAGEQSSKNQFDRYYNAGVRAAEIHAWSEAKSKLLGAIREAKKITGTQGQLARARIILADVFRGEEDYEQAGQLYAQCLSIARRAFGEQSAEYARALNGLAYVNFARFRWQKAEAQARAALEIRAALYGKEHHDYAESLAALAAICGAEGWHDEATAYFQEALSILKNSKTSNKLDYSDALRLAGLYYQDRGKRATAKRLLDESFEIKDAVFQMDQPARVGSDVLFKWEDGSPRALEIADSQYPLRYMTTNNIRVAATIVDLLELVGVLVSVTNVGDQRVELGLGDPTLTEVLPQQRKVEFVDARRIDHVNREKTIWDYTSTRPWLANIQKTRAVRGLVPSRGHDMFRGPNIFGIYGHWGVSSRILPERLALQRSPEHLESQEKAVIETDLVRTGNLSIPGMHSIALEPFESRTGVLYFLNPHADKLSLRVPVGNAVFELPFNMPIWKRR